MRTYLAAAPNRNALVAQGIGALPGLLSGDMSGALGGALDGTVIVFRTAVTPEISVDLGALARAMSSPPGPGEPQPIESVTEPALPFLRPQVALLARGQTVADWAPYGAPPQWFWPIMLGGAGLGVGLGLWTLWRAFGPRRKNPLGAISGRRDFEAWEREERDERSRRPKPGQRAIEKSIRRHKKRRERRRNPDEPQREMWTLDQRFHPGWRGADDKPKPPKPKQTFFDWTPTQDMFAPKTKNALRRRRR